MYVLAIISLLVSAMVCSVNSNKGKIKLMIFLILISVLFLSYAIIDAGGLSRLLSMEETDTNYYLYSVLSGVSVVCSFFSVITALRLKRE